MADRAALLAHARLSIIARVEELCRRQPPVRPRPRANGSGCSMPGAAPATIWPMRRTMAARWAIRPDADERLATIRSLTDHGACRASQPAIPPSTRSALSRAKCGITRAMAEDVIAGFALDAAGWRPQSEADMLRYCYHVAGAVGVMMAAGHGRRAAMTTTRSTAPATWASPSSSPISPAISARTTAAGRCYLPADWLAEADIPPGEQMEPRYRRALAAAGAAAVRAWNAPMKPQPASARRACPSAGAGRCCPPPASTARSPARSWPPASMPGITANRHRRPRKLPGSCVRSSSRSSRLCDVHPGPHCHGETLRLNSGGWPEQPGETGVHVRCRAPAPGLRNHTQAGPWPADGPSRRKPAR